MEEELKKMEKKNEKKTFKGTAKAVGLASKLSPKSQRKKDALLSSTAQLKVKNNNQWKLYWLISKKYRIKVCESFGSWKALKI